MSQIHGKSRTELTVFAAGEFEETANNSSSSGHVMSIALVVPTSARIHLYNTRIHSHRGRREAGGLRDSTDNDWHSKHQWSSSSWTRHWRGHVLTQQSRVELAILKKPITGAWDPEMYTSDTGERAEGLQRSTGDILPQEWLAR